MQLIDEYQIMLDQRSQTQKYILYDSIYTKFYNRQN